MAFNIRPSGEALSAKEAWVALLGNVGIPEDVPSPFGAPARGRVVGGNVNEVVVAVLALASFAMRTSARVVLDQGVWMGAFPIAAWGLCPRTRTHVQRTCGSLRACGGVLIRGKSCVVGRAIKEECCIVTRVLVSVF